MIRIRGRRIVIDGTKHGSVWSCGRCGDSGGPYSSPAAARLVADQHWYAWHAHAARTTGCSYPSCEGAHHGLGYCATHYRRVVRRGDPNVTARAGRKKKAA